MAFHTTSMRAKEALRGFRRRTEASRQEREASAVTPPQAEEPTVKTDSSSTESTSETETKGVPPVVVSGSEGEQDTGSTLEEADKEQGEQEEDIVDNPSVSTDLEEVKESSEHESEGGEFESEEDLVQTA